MPIIAIAFVMSSIVPAAADECEGVSINESYCPEGKECGTVTLKNEGCKRGIFSFEENKVKVNFWNAPWPNELCTEHTYEFNTGEDITLGLKGWFTLKLNGERQTCCYRHEAEGTALLQGHVK